METLDDVIQKKMSKYKIIKRFFYGTDRIHRRCNGAKR